MIFFEKYSSPLEMSRVIQARQCNGKMGKTIYSNVNNPGDFPLKKSFHGVKNFTEAEDFLTKGDKMLYDKVKDEVINFNKSLTTVKRKLTYDVYGTSVSVGRAIAGHPRNMIRREKTEQKLRAVNVLYDNSVCANINSNDLLRAGIAMLKAIQVCEQIKQIRIDLNISAFSSLVNNGDKFYCIINIKHAQQPLDLLKVVYPLCNPAMFRTHGFLWSETIPGPTCLDIGKGKDIPANAYFTDLAKYGYPKNNNSVIIRFQDVRACDYNYQTILDKFFNIGK